LTTQKKESGVEPPHSKVCLQMTWRPFPAHGKLRRHANFADFLSTLSRRDG
jgi:hypothetical protein